MSNIADAPCIIVTVCPCWSHEYIPGFDGARVVLIFFSKLGINKTCIFRGCNISLIPCIKSSRVGHFVMICFVHKTVSLKIFDKREKYGVKILPHEYMACSRSLHWINTCTRVHDS
jgi:hypothetical protein